jgi:hypothetical protein
MRDRAVTRTAREDVGNPAVVHNRPNTGRKRGGTADATAPVVGFSRTVLPAVARVAVLTLLATHVVLSAAPLHLACMVAHHASGSTTTMSACCCGGDSEASRQAGPTVPAVRVPPAPEVVIFPAPIQCVPSPMDDIVDAPCAVSHDLPILLANLRL